jgi:RNA polymerase sigma-70 factor (family 1)
VELNEQQYWQHISNGDKNAYEFIFKRYYQSLCNYACSIIKDKDEAEEVVQNVFYIIWNKRLELSISTSIKSYLYRAVHNDCLNKLKHLKVKNSYSQDFKNSNLNVSENGLSTLERKELNIRIYQAIDSLPEQCGNVFKLSRFENFKYSDIAEELNISIKTVENHMGKALKLLRVKLADYLPIIFILLILN